jgi:division protein CdvB (Snf7/Vps24/ESCRT-III family)
MMGDTMDEAMEGENDEEEEAAIVSQILEEIGLNASELVPDAPSGAPIRSVATNAAEEPEKQAVSADPAVSELEARLNNLRNN